MPEQTGHNTQPHVQLTPRFQGMDAWMISQMDVALIRKLSGSLMSLAYFDMLYMCVCTTRHCQTSGRLVQELNVCTVCPRPSLSKYLITTCIGGLFTIRENDDLRLSVISSGEI